MSSIANVWDLACNTLIPLEHIKLPEISTTTRMILREVEFKLDEKERNFYLPDLVAAVGMCRAESLANQKSLTLIDRVLPVVTITLLLSGVTFYVHLIAVTIFGLVTTSIVLAVTLPFIAYLMIFRSGLERSNPQAYYAEGLKTKITKFEQYFSDRRFQLLKGHLERIIAENNKEAEKARPYKTALEQFQNGYGFCCLTRPM